MNLADPAQQVLLLKVMNDPHRPWLYFTEALLLIALFLFRSWQLPQKKTFAARVFLKLWTLILYVVLAGYLAPRFWLGEDFVPVLKAFLGL